MFMHELVYCLHCIYCIHMQGMLCYLNGIRAKNRGNETQRGGWVRYKAVRGRNSKKFENDSCDRRHFLCGVAQPGWLGMLQCGIRATGSILSLHGPASRTLEI
jgi:hypothetical protein